MIYLLTIQQKDSLVGQFYAPSCMFNPIQDINGDWFITSQEVIDCVNPDLQWVKDLPQMSFTPPPLVENRTQKVDAITSFMKSELTEIQFREFISDARNYLIDYTYYSDTLYYWVGTTFSAEWGDFTTNGFKTKINYRGDLVDGLYPRAEYILSVLSPTN